MQTIIHRGTVNLNLLHEEFIANVSTFERTTVDTDGFNVADDDSGRVEGDAVQTKVAFADDILPAAVQAVIDAHDPTARSAGEIIEDTRKTAEADLRAFDLATIQDRDARQFIRDLKIYLGF